MLNLRYQVCFILSTSERLVLLGLYAVRDFVLWGELPPESVQSRKSMIAAD